MSITSDLTFPIVPEISTVNVEQLTQDEYLCLLEYVVLAEAVFDIITQREYLLLEKSK